MLSDITYDGLTPSKTAMILLHYFLITLTGAKYSKLLDVLYNI